MTTFASREPFAGQTDDLREFRNLLREEFTPASVFVGGAAVGRAIEGGNVFPQVGQPPSALAGIEYMAVYRGTAVRVAQELTGFEARRNAGLLAKYACGSNSWVQGRRAAMIAEIVTSQPRLGVMAEVFEVRDPDHPDVLAMRAGMRENRKHKIDPLKDVGALALIRNVLANGNRYLPGRPVHEVELTEQ